jgi:hypothetical protein
MPMPFLRVLIALLMCASVSLAEPVKLHTLTGQALQGELTALSNKEIVLQVDGKSVETPITQVVDLEIQAISQQQAAATFADVELTDGSLLHCSQFSFKGKTANLKLTTGQDVAVPLAAISYLLNGAENADVRSAWTNLVAGRGRSDLLAVKDKQGEIQPFQGTFGDVSEDGEKIGFETSSGTKTRVPLTKIHGMSFFRQPDPQARPILCKVFDTAGDVLAAADFSGGSNGITITTVSGAKVTVGQPLLARLDFSKGKLTYLSNMDPLKIVESSAVDRVDHYRRDRNLDNDPIRLGRETFAKGLALHATTELTYDIGGQYKEFRCVVGADPGVGGDTHARVVIEGDGNKLFGAVVTRSKITVDGDAQDKPNPLPVSLNVQNIKQLRIIVTPVGFLDLGDHVTLADAKVSK